MLNPGDVINGKYRIVRLIGDGGMGSVYEAKHELLGTKVALKFLHPELAEQSNLKQRFLQEAQVSANIGNEHIVGVSDVDSAEQGAYLVMEMLEGEPLQHLLDTQGKLSVALTLNFTSQIIDGLSSAHANQIVHRDLKPDNVFITSHRGGPLLKLLDFGIAKLRHSEEYQMTLTRPGSVMGTPEYMAPEQAYSADLVDQRSDIYSLGVMMFEMLSGQLPAEGDTPQEIAEQVLKGQSKNLAQLCPNLDPRLTAIVNRAMAPRPEDRFKTVLELAEALRPIQDALGLDATLPGPPVDNATGLATAYSHDQLSFGSSGRTAITHAEGTQKKTDPMSPGGPITTTLPPETSEPPAASRLPPAVKTASMPEVNSMAPAAPVPQPYLSASPPAPTRRSRRKSHLGAWLFAVVVLLGGGAGAGIYYYEYYEDFPPAPPMPTRRVQSPAGKATQAPPSQELPNVSDVEPDAFVTPEAPAPVKHPESPGRASPAPPAASLPPLPTTLPPLPTKLPPLPDAIMSSIPTSFPTAIPTNLPIPGLLPAPSAKPSK